MTQTQSKSVLREGIAAAQAGNKVRARAVIRQVVSADPDNEVAWLWLANLAPDPAEAVECLRQVLALNPKNSHALASLPNVLVRAGANAAQSNDAPTARRLLIEATGLNPASELGWLWLAGVAETPHDGVKYLTRVLELNPANDRARAGLLHYESELGPWACPLCSARAGRPQSRCRACRAVVSLDDPAAFDLPPDPDVPAVAAAADRLAPLAAKAPGGPAAFYLGLAYLNLGRPADAINVFNAAALHPDADPAWKDAVRKLAKHWRSADPLAEQSAPDMPAPRTIMVVDDSPTVRKLVAVALEPAGYFVVSLSSGLKVAAALKEHGPPDLVILDINMPELDGFQVCKMLRNAEATAAVPVVFLTGKDGFFNKLRGQWAGAAEYLTKPFQPAALAAVVDKILAARPAR